MLFTTHAIVGAALGSATGSPYAGFLLSAASHHVLDAIPHFDQGSFYSRRTQPNYIGALAEDIVFKFSRRDWIMLFIDWAVAGILFLAILAASPSLDFRIAIAGAIGGLLPDIIDSSPLWSKRLREKASLISSYHSFHKFFHWTVPQNQIVLGVVTQVAAIATAFYYLIL